MHAFLPEVDRRPLGRVDEVADPALVGDVPRVEDAVTRRFVPHPVHRAGVVLRPRLRRVAHAVRCGHRAQRKLRRDEGDRFLAISRRVAHLSLARLLEEREGVRRAVEIGEGDDDVAFASGPGVVRRRR